MIGTSKVILVVDDEAAVRARMSRLLRGAGYKVIASRDYAEAVALYRRRYEEIDMVVADVSLPGYYGCEIANEALRLNPAVTMLFTSGNAGAEACKFYGINPTDMHFLKKPFHDADLIARVQQLLEEKPQALTGGASA